MFGPSIPPDGGAGKRGDAVLFALACIFLCLNWTGDTRVHAARPRSSAKETQMKNHAKGTFEVKMNPQKQDNDEARIANITRMSGDKQFSGDLDGTGKGEMLAVVTEVKGSAGYVAMERVTGRLNGKTGSFVLQHSAMMVDDVPQNWSVTVLLNSGTGQLAGITGAMTIRIENGKHFYDFVYTLPEN
jgi:hypothetical protein